MSCPGAPLHPNEIVKCFISRAGTAERSARPTLFHILRSLSQKWKLCHKYKHVIYVQEPSSDALPAVENGPAGRLMLRPPAQFSMYVGSHNNNNLGGFGAFG